VILDLAPLDAEGIRLNRPSHEVRWSKLENVVFKDGALIPRPGFREAFDYTLEIDAANVEPAPANGVLEIYNPGDTATGRGAGEWTSEILRPDGSSSVVAGWSASSTTLHGDVDEAVPDGAYIVSTTKGSQVRYTFANPSATYTNVLGVRFYVRARVEYTGVNDAIATLRLIQHYSGATATIAEFDVWAFDVNETTFWYDYSFFAEKDLIDDYPWTDTDLDNLNMDILFVDGSSGIAYTFTPTSIASNTGWVDAADGGAAVYTDLIMGRNAYNGPLPDTTPDGRYSQPVWEAVKAPNGLTANDANDVIEVGYDTVPAGVTFSQVDFVKVNFRVKSQAYRPVPYEIYYNNGAVDTLIDSGTTSTACAPYEQPLVVTMTTNPVSAAEWTKTEINAATFKLKITESVPLIIVGSEVQVQGLTNAAEVRVDTVSAEIIGLGDTDPPDKLVLSNKSFLRYETIDYTLDDVTNSVPSTSLPSLSAFDWAILYGQVYVVNGVDPTKRYPNSSDLFESLTTNDGAGANPLTGRTVAAFADRILYGWTRDNTTYTPERIAYSNFANGGAHSGASAGTFDIIDSQGGIVALRTLNEGLCFCGKEFGVYALRRTGNDAAPIIVDPIDYETQCLARASALRVLLQGQPVIIFLGSNPSGGLNVFAFDGTAVKPIGDAINPLLEEKANSKTLSMAVGGVDPSTNTYMIFLASGRGIDRTTILSMNLNTLAWTTGELPYGVYSTGMWSIPVPGALVTAAGWDDFRGLQTMVVGGRNNLIQQTHPLPYDTLTPVQTASLTITELQPGFDFGSDPRPSEKNIFTSTMETGDFQFMDDQRGELQMMSYRVHLDYVNLGPVRVGLSASTDGGSTWTTEEIQYVGDSSKDSSRRHALLTFGENPVHDRAVRFRLRVIPSDSTWETPYAWQFTRISIDYELGGVDGA